MKHIIENGETIQVTLARLTDTKPLQELTDEILALIKTQDLKAVTLDLYKVSSITSAGLGVLLTLRKIVPVTLRNANANILAVLNVTKLNTLFTIQ
jgi:anti-anti-sigma factor